MLNTSRPEIRMQRWNPQARTMLSTCGQHDVKHAVDFRVIYNILTLTNSLQIRRKNPPEIRRQKSAAEKSVARNPSPESVARNLSGKLWHWCRELTAPKSTRRRETKPKTTNHVCGKPPLLRPNVAHRLYLPMEQL